MLRLKTGSLSEKEKVLPLPSGAQDCYKWGHPFLACTLLMLGALKALEFSFVIRKIRRDSPIERNS